VNTDRDGFVAVNPDPGNPDGSQRTEYHVSAARFSYAGLPNGAKGEYAIVRTLR
jgi:hypothetical protein